MKRLLLAICSLLPTASHAGRFDAFGMGENGYLSCGGYTSQIKVPQKQAYWTSYIAGYFTGMNQARSRQVSTDLDGIMAAVALYCSNHPLDPLNRHACGSSFETFVSNGCTQRPVQFEIMQATRDALQAWVKQAGLKAEDFLFPSRLHDSPHLGTQTVCPDSRALGRGAGPKPR